MRRRTSKIAAIAAAIGLTLAVAATASPASAAKPGGGETVVAATYSCATFEGLTLTQQSVSYDGIGLRAGESITARMSPASTGDEIFLSAGSGLSLSFFSAPAAGGLTFTSSGGGTYSLAWSLKAAGAVPSSITWTFDCSSSTGGTTPPTAPADDDRDGVANTADSCAGTVLPDAVSRPVAGKYYADRNGSFIDGTGRSSGVTVVAAGGCSATQIAKALRLPVKDVKSGISLSVLNSWATAH